MEQAAVLHECPARMGLVLPSPLWTCVLAIMPLRLTLPSDCVGLHSRCEWVRHAQQRAVWCWPSQQLQTGRRLVYLMPPQALECWPAAMRAPSHVASSAPAATKGAANPKNCHHPAATRTEGAKELQPFLESTPWQQPGLWPSVQQM